MSTVLVTGANRGLGLEFCRQYLRDGWVVLATCRSPDRAYELLSLQGTHPNLSVFRIDLADECSWRLFSGAYLDGGIDLLIHNAAKFSVDPGDGDAGLALRGQEWQEMFFVNAIGPVLLSLHLLPMLLRSRCPKIIALGSVKGSIARNSVGGSYEYRSTKAALNSAFRSLSIDLREKGVIVGVLSPGWVPFGQVAGLDGLDFRARLMRGRRFFKELGQTEKTRQTPQESVQSMRQTISNWSLGDSGAFLDHCGRKIPW